MEEDGEDKDDSKRRTRNLSEKKRRDQFNLLVNELSMMIATNNRKMDKSTVLKSVINFLRNHNEVSVKSRAYDVQEDWKPAFLANEEFTYLVLEAMEGFILVFSGNGRINYVSESVMSLLGHHSNDILNTNIYDLIPDVDHQHIYNIIHHYRGVDSSQLSENENSIQFQCHFKRGTLDFRDRTTYELIDFVGTVRTNVEVDDSDEQDRSQSSEASRLLFICTGRFMKPQLTRDVSLVDSSQNEFVSRHSLEWKFLFLDHRAPPIIGYLPFELLGTSGYDYYHFDDLESVIHCHETLMQKGELTSGYYRFLTKGQQWIWLQTRFYITYHQWNSKPEFVVCTHRVVSNDDLLKYKKTETLKDEVLIAEGDNSNSQMTVKEPRSEEPIPQASPSYYSDNTEESYIHRPEVLPSNSVSPGSSGISATAVTSTASSFAPGWSSGYSGSGCPTVTVDAPYPQHDDSSVPGLVEQSSLLPYVGVQYLNVLPFKTSPQRSVMPPAVLPALPVVLSYDHVQVQDQLQRKHEHLQQMIERQQEELRQVKEQLAMARLGILHPNVPGTVQPPYSGPQEQPPPQSIVPPVLYDNSRNVAYPPQQEAPHHSNRDHTQSPQ